MIRALDELWQGTVLYKRIAESEADPSLLSKIGLIVDLDLKTKNNYPLTQIGNILFPPKDTLEKALKKYGADASLASNVKNVYQFGKNNLSYNGLCASLQRSLLEPSVLDDFTTLGGVHVLSDQSPNDFSSISRIKKWTIFCSDLLKNTTDETSQKIIATHAAFPYYTFDNGSYKIDQPTWYYDSWNAASGKLQRICKEECGLDIDIEAMEDMTRVWN